ncbi:MAG TPA: DUF6427 family protein [Bacteroidales bacterium]
MLLRVSRSSNPSLPIILLILSLVFWFNGFTEVSLNNHIYHFSPFYDLIKLLPQQAGIIQSLLGILALWFVAFSLIRINSRFIIIQERTYLPVLFYFVMIFAITKINYLHPALIAAIFISIALERLFHSNKNENLSYNPFDAAFFITLAAFFYFPAIFFNVIVWLALLIMRPFYWREWVYSIIGMFVPSFFILSIFYLTGTNFQYILKSAKLLFTVRNDISITITDALFLSFCMVMLLIASAHMIAMMGKFKILTRKAYNLFLALFLVSVVVYIFVPSVGLEIIFIGALPISQLFTNYYLNAPATRFRETVFDLFIIFFVLTQLIKQ